MKKSTKHMQFIRISLLIFALGFFFACSLGTQRYGKLSLSIEIPEYLKTEPNEQPSNARFIHPDGKKLEFQLFVRDELFFEQTIPLNSGKQNDAQTRIPISVDKVPYNVPLFAEITVYGEVATGSGTPPILGQNTIDIGRLRYPTKKLTLGVKPVSDTTVVYKGYQVDQDLGINLFVPDGTYADTFNIIMFPKKGLYTFCVDKYADIYLYDSDGKKYQNSFIIDSLDSRVRVFYHPENEASIYYAYLGPEQSNVSGEKLKQDILITRRDDDDVADVIVGSEERPITINSEGSSFTIYNPYPFTLNLKNTIENADEEDEKNSKDKFTFDFPDVLVLLPGKSEDFTVNFQDDNPVYGDTYSVKSTISAPGLKKFVLIFTGSAFGV